MKSPSHVNKNKKGADYHNYKMDLQEPNLYQDQNDTLGMQINTREVEKRLLELMRSTRRKKSESTEWDNLVNDDLRANNISTFVLNGNNEKKANKNSSPLTKMRNSDFIGSKKTVSPPDFSRSQSTGHKWSPSLLGDSEANVEIYEEGQFGVASTSLND
jgi:hypothetical protein